ncbi:mycothiol transferase [Pedococcus sp. P5_B7]
MTLGELLVDAFDRIREGACDAVDGLTPDQLAERPSDRANSIGWLVWHLARVQDDHVAAVADREQVWTGEGWHERFGLPFDADDTGYGHTSEQVAQVRGLAADDLVAYLEAVHAVTVEFVRPLTPDDLGRVVDERWDPPVTLGVRLVSVVNDDQQHVGQAAFIRGSLTR